MTFSTKDGAANARKLASRADVLIENFLPSQLRSFGLDAQSLLETLPRLIYCSITGFGSHNEMPGYDFVVQAIGGLMSITGDPSGDGHKVGVAVVDVLSALNAVIAIQAALHVRARTGAGQHVSLNLFPPSWHLSPIKSRHT